MGRYYTVEFDNVSVSAIQDLFAVVPAAQKPIELVGLCLAQSSDVGDSEEEILRWRVIRGHTTAGSGGSAPTVRPLAEFAASAGFTARTNDTTIASAGTAVNLHSDAFNIRVGLQFWWPEDARPDCSVATANNRLVVRLLAAPADAITMSGTLYVHEK